MASVRLCEIGKAGGIAGNRTLASLWLDLSKLVVEVVITEDVLTC